MEFTLPPDIDDMRRRIRRFVDEKLIPLEADRANFDEHENIAPHVLAEMRKAAKAEGLWALQMPKRLGGQELPRIGMAACYEEMNRSIFGPVVFNSAAPDDGNMMILDRVLPEAMKPRWLQPIVNGDVQSAFAMTEPDGCGSDPNLTYTKAERVGNDRWRITGRKWFITGAVGAAFGIVMARTGNQATMFLLPLPAPGLTIERVMGSVDHTMPGGHSVVRLDRVRVPRSMVLGELHEGFRYAQVRLAPARLTHCMRWWGAAQRAHHIAARYAQGRTAFGKPLLEHEGVGFALARNEIDLKQTELMIDWAAWTLDQGQRGSSESSMTKYACAETLFQVVDRCVQVLGGSGIVDETPVSKIWREIRGFRVYDGPSEVHLYSLARKLGRNLPSN